METKFLNASLEGTAEQAEVKNAKPSTIQIISEKNNKVVAKVPYAKAVKLRDALFVVNDYFSVEFGFDEEEGVLFVDLKK